MFINSLDNKRYYTLNYYFRKKFGCKVAKIPLDAGFTCPNKKSGGCIYCVDGSAANIIDSKISVINQFNSEIKLYNKKWPGCKYIAYLQSGTNTYNNLDKLKCIVDELIKVDNCLGISIATRPDCINTECLNYLNELNKKTFLTIELGLQSSNNNTLKIINRGHLKEDFTNCINKLHDKNIFVVAHIINGLPYETKEHMVNTVKYLNDLKIDGIKIHMLHILKNTKLEKIYVENKLNILSKEEYIDIVCTQLEYLNNNIVIERITGDPIKNLLVEPKWLLNKTVVLNSIDKEMVKRNIYQGDKLN